MEDNEIDAMRQEASLPDRLDNLEREVAKLYGMVLGVQQAVKAILVAAKIARDTNRKDTAPQGGEEKKVDGKEAGVA